MERPEGLIITISAAMLKERGAKNWLSEFFSTMEQEGYTYWMKLGNRPKVEPLYVYLLTNGKIRYRANFVMYEKGEMTFLNGKSMAARTWCVMTGPLVRPHKGQEPAMKGFQGFRYTNKLF